MKYEIKLAFWNEMVYYGYKVTNWLQNQLRQPELKLMIFQI